MLILKMLGRRVYCQNNMGELCWKGIKAIAAVMLCIPVLYAAFMMVTTHPCWHSSQCFSTLVMGSSFDRTQNASIAYKEPTSLDHVVFGIAASANKWRKRRDYVNLWWKPGKTRGFVWLDRVPANEPSSPPLRTSEDTSGFSYTHPSGLRSAIRISRIVSETFRLGFPNVRWFVMGDDDTMFFPENLVQVLSKYDHNQFYYIGSNSECTEQNVMHSYGTAFGGGGFAISYPLAKALEKIQDKCLQRYPNLYGSDQRIQACLAELGVPLTKEPGIHQVDIHGDLFGLLAAHPIAPLVSLHHLDAVAPIFPNMTRVAALRHLMGSVRIDPSRVVQQSICYDNRRNWTISVSWGYSVQIYDRIELPRLLENPLQTFVTWRNNGRFPFMFNTRPIPKNPCDRPNIFFIKRVKNSKKNIVSSYTKHEYESIGSTKCEQKNDSEVHAMQNIEVVSDKIRADLWNQAPRRQCCDVVSYHKGLMKIKIRSCGEEEATSPRS